MQIGTSFVKYIPGEMGLFSLPSETYNGVS